MVLGGGFSEEDRSGDFNGSFVDDLLKPVDLSVTNSCCEVFVWTGALLRRRHVVLEKYSQMTVIKR